MSTSSSSVSSTSSTSYNRLSGLESGLDTETIIEGLTANVTSKINAANQQKQILTWKRDYYREIITKLTDFNSKYFASGTTSFDKLLSGYKTTNTGSDYVSVKAGTSASKSNIIISDILSLATSSTYSSSSAVSKTASLTVDTASLSSLSGKSLAVTLDGTQKTITFGNGTYTDATSVKDALQSLLNTSFGTGRITVNEDSGNLTLQSDGNTIVLGKTAENDVSSILGFTDGASNRIDLSNKLSDISLNHTTGSDIAFTINGKDFTFNSSSTMRDVMSAVNSSSAGVTMSYSSLTDTFTLTSKQTGTGSQITVADTAGSLISSVFGTGIFTDGTNAQIKINTNAASGDAGSLTYTTITKSSNTFDLDGVTYSLLGKADGNQTENIRIGIDYDIDSAVSSVKTFVDDYNTMLKSVTDKLGETKYKGFSPLTDEQRAALSTSDAEAYDIKAKSGLLVNDTFLTSVASSLRNAMYSKVGQLSDNTQEIGMILSDIGITTGLFSEKGKLHVDETKLRAALTDTPDQVKKLLTQRASVEYSPYLSETSRQKRNVESGLFNKISDVLQNNIRSTTGALTKLVGTSNNDYNTVYAGKLDDIDDKIDLLKDQLKKDQDRYWAKFTKMETALSEMNKKSAWLASQTSSSS